MEPTTAMAMATPASTETPTMTGAEIMRAVISLTKKTKSGKPDPAANLLLRLLLAEEEVSSAMLTTARNIYRQAQG